MDYYVKLSRFLSLILRHEPEKIGIELDAQGWTNCQTLLDRSQSRFPGFNRKMLEQIVATNDKQRFAFSEDGRFIRANQGHSVEIDLGLEPEAPPALLYHGTVSRFLDSIREEGLVKRQRHHVHLSADQHTANKVGERRGKPVILAIRAAEMHAAGLIFYRSGNGVWLTDTVPPEFIDFAASA